MGDWTNALIVLLVFALLFTDFRYTINELSYLLYDSWFAVFVFLGVLAFASLNYPR